MNDLAVSRRAVTCALATLPAIVIPTFAAATSRGGADGVNAMNALSTIISAGEAPTWEATMARYEAAQAASDRFHVDVFEPVARELDRRAPRPSLSFSVTAKNGKVAHYEMLPGELDEWAESDLWGRYAAPIRDAWNAYIAQTKAAEIDLGWNAIDAQNELLWAAVNEAHEELMLMPAPNLAALRWKLEQTVEPGEAGSIAVWNDEYRLAIVADYERLLPAGS